MIAWRNGSVPEIIEDGVTGFVVEDIEQAVRAVRQVAGLSRETCHKMFEERFDATRMAADYIEVYRRLKYFQADSIDHAAHAFGTPARDNGAGRSHARVRPSVAVPPWGAAQTV